MNAVTRIEDNGEEERDLEHVMAELWKEHPLQASVVEAMAYSPSLSSAAGIANVSPHAAYKWRQRSELFQEALKLMEPVYADMLREKIHERAVAGYAEPVIYKGELQFRRDPLTGALELDDNFEPIPLTQRVHSDRLLERMAEAKLPEYAAGRRGGGGVNIGIGGSGEGGNAGTRIEVNFVEAPDWESVEWDEETGRPVLEGQMKDVTPDG